MTRYQKSELTVEKQVELLLSRGLIIDDASTAAAYLSNISYYRLSAYLLPYKEQGLNKFKEGVTFDQVLDTYIFDRELRLLVFDAIERIEIAVRTQVILQPSLAFGGGYWYQDAANFLKAGVLDDHLLRLDEEYARSKETFITHFKSTYEDERPPAWIVFEILSFGQVTSLVQNLRDYSVRNSIAKHFGFSGTQRHIFESWITTLVYIRNLCAHHSRLWNRILTLQPSRLGKTEHPWLADPSSVTNTKLYHSLCLIKYLLSRIIPTNSFSEQLLSLIQKYRHLPLEMMDLPENWMSDPVWGFDSATIS